MVSSLGRMSLVKLILVFTLYSRSYLILKQEAYGRANMIDETVLLCFACNTQVSLGLLCSSLSTAVLKLVGTVPVMSDTLTISTVHF